MRKENFDFSSSSLSGTVAATTTTTTTSGFVQDIHDKIKETAFRNSTSPLFLSSRLARFAGEKQRSDGRTHAYRTTCRQGVHVGGNAKTPNRSLILVSTFFSLSHTSFYVLKVCVFFLSFFLSSLLSLFLFFFFRNFYSSFFHSIYFFLNFYSFLSTFLSYLHPSLEPCIRSLFFPPSLSASLHYLFPGFPRPSTSSFPTASLLLLSLSLSPSSPSGSPLSAGQPSPTDSSAFPAAPSLSSSHQFSPPYTEFIPASASAAFYDPTFAPRNGEGGGGGGGGGGSLPARSASATQQYLSYAQPPRHQAVPTPHHLNLSPYFNSLDSGVMLPSSSSSATSHVVFSSPTMPSSSAMGPFVDSASSCSSRTYPSVEADEYLQKFHNRIKAVLVEAGRAQLTADTCAERVNSVIRSFPVELKTYEGGCTVHA